MQPSRQIFSLLLALTVLLGACSSNTSDQASNDNKANEENDELNEEAKREGPPSMDDLDPDDELTPFIERGKDLLDGSESISDEEGDKLSCMSCHADGDDTDGESLVGVTSEYPKYDDRNDAVITMEEKVNDSIMHTLNGEPISYDSEEMRSIIAFLTYISKGESYEEHQDDKTVEDFSNPDLDNGEALYEKKIKDASPPDLFGKNSFTDGSTLSRMSVMTDYVKNYLPEDDPGSLSDQEATDAAAYILSQDRPEWRKDDPEWRSNKPDDFINKPERKKIEDNDFDWSQISKD